MTRPPQRFLLSSSQPRKMAAGKGGRVGYPGKHNIDTFKMYIDNSLDVGLKPSHRDSVAILQKKILNSRVENLAVTYI